MDKDDTVVLDAGLDNQVSDASSVGESGDVTADLVEGYGEVLAQDTGQLALGLVSDDGNWRRRVDLTTLTGEGAARSLGHGGVNTTAHALVGRDDDEQLALSRGLSGRMLEDLCGCVSEADAVG